MPNKENIESFLKAESLEVEQNYDLSYHTFIKTGGNADYYFSPKDLPSLKKLFQFLCSNKIPYKIIGNGSNLLISDRGVRGFVISPENLPRKINVGSNYIHVSTNFSNDKFLNFCKKNGVGGLEFLSGIPGTVGGLIAMNAGAFGSTIADFLFDVNVLDAQGKMQNLQKSQLKFDYRNIELNMSDYFFTSARLTYDKSDSEKTTKRCDQFLKRRTTLHLNNYPTFGSVFKNGSDYYAGRILDQCGLKGASVGAATIAEDHANFIINKGDATSADVYKLIKFAQKKAKEKFDIHLQPEVKLWGDFSYVK